MIEALIGYVKYLVNLRYVKYLVNRPLTVKRLLVSPLMVVLGATALTSVAENFGFFNGMWVLDPVMYLRAGGSIDGFKIRGVQALSKDIALVTITDPDYEDYFGGTSPLDPCTVAELIRDVQSMNPTAIGVDLDTSALAWVKCKECDRLLPEHANVFWAQLPEQPDSNEQEPYKLGRVRGRPTRTFADSKSAAPADSGPPPDDFPQELQGLVVFPLDPDGVVRQYQSEFDVVDKNNKNSQMPSLARRLVCYGSGRGFPPLRNSESGKEPIFFNLVNLEDLEKDRKKLIQDRSTGKTEERPYFVDAGEVFRINAEELSHTCGQKRGNPDGGMSRNEEALREFIKFKIVLIGGSFSTARDTYETAMGTIPGIELIAAAIDSDWRGGIKEIEGWAKVFDILMGLGVVWIFYGVGEVPRKRPLLALIVATLGSVAILFVAALLFLIWRYWLNAVPVIAGVNIHQYYEHARLAYHQSHPEKSSSDA